MASGLSVRDDEMQVNTLIYTMGDEGDDALCFFDLSEADRKKYDVVRGSLKLNAETLFSSGPSLTCGNRRKARPSRPS